MSNDSEPTHRLSQELQDKLSEAKDWHDEREELEAQIRQFGGDAGRNQEDRDISDRQGADILAGIVEIIDRTWGFAQRLRRP